MNGLFAAMVCMGYVGQNTQCATKVREILTRKIEAQSSCIRTRRHMHGRVAEEQQCPTSEWAPRTLLVAWGQARSMQPDRGARLLCQRSTVHFFLTKPIKTDQFYA
jgi:hypothetical protein